MSAYTEIPKIIAETGELPPKVLGNLDARFSPQNTTDFWVHPDTGNDDTGDGSESAPYATLGRAIRIAETMALSRAASVNIRLFPGAYHEAPRFTRSTGFNLNVNIIGADVGGHPNVPLTVFDGQGATGASIYGANQALTLTIQDVKFINYDTIPVSMVRANLFTINVHVQDSAGGIRLTNGAIDVKGGIFTDVGYKLDGSPGYAGIISFMANRHSIGQQHGTLADGPWFFGGYRGVLVQECATGHVDYCTFEDLAIAITSNRSSSVNPDGSSFKRNGLDLRAINASSIVLGDRVSFGSGPDASSQQMFADATSMLSTSVHWSGAASGNAIAQRLHSEDAREQPLTSGTLTLFRETLAPNFFNDTRPSNLSPSKAIAVRAVGEITDPAGTKRITLQLGATAIIVTIRANYTGPVIIEAETIFHHKSDQLMTLTVLCGDEPVRMRIAKAHENVGATPQLILSARLMDSPDGEMQFYTVQSWMRGI